MDKKCKVSPANHFRVVADAFRPSSIHQRYEYLINDKLHKCEVLLIASTPLVVNGENIYRNTTKMQESGEGSAHLYGEEQSF